MLNTPQQSPERLHGMDALRAIAMLLGIVLHATISYKVFHDPSTWPADPQYHFIGYDYLYLWIHSFRMQLFYLVAGFFARFLYLKIGEKPFIRHRAKRILLPFILSLILLVPFSLTPFLYYHFRHFPHPWHDVARQLLRWNGMVHFWFLYYLLFFYVAMLILIHLGKLIRISLPGKDSARKLPDLSLYRTVLVLVIPLTALLYLFNTPMVEVYTGIFPKITYFSYFGFFFLLGWWLNNRMDCLRKTSRLGWPLLLIGTALTWPMMYLTTREASLSLHLGGLYWLIVRSLGALQTISLVFGGLGLFMHYFREESRTLRYISDSSYWLYLIHMGILASLQILFFHSLIPGPFRFFLVLSITLGISFISYDWFIRYTIIGEMLHGKRKRMHKHPIPGKPSSTA